LPPTAPNSSASQNESRPRSNERSLSHDPFGPTFDRERHNALILSHGLWQRQFGGDPAIVGRTIEVDATPGLATPRYTVAARKTAAESVVNATLVTQARRVTIVIRS